MKYLANFDYNQNEIQNTVIQNLATAPTNPTPRKGQIYFNTSTNRMMSFNGTVWVGADALDAMMSGTSIVTAINASTSIIDNDNLSAQVNSAITNTHSPTHAISAVTGLQTALDSKVNNTQVLTNVPAGATFTDTVYTHPTGAGNNHIPTGGSVGQVLKNSASGTTTWGTDNDTIYTHPTTDGNLHVPATSTTNSGKVLTAGATAGSLSWVTPPINYTLPIASVSVLGGVKSGTDITVDASGNVSVNDDSHAHVVGNVDGLQALLDAKETPTGAQNKATTALTSAQTYTNTAIANLVGGSQASLDTLNEFASALGNDANFSTTITNLISLRTRKFVSPVGNGTLTVIPVVHGLTSQDVSVTIRETVSPFALVMTDVAFTSTSTVTLSFAVAPTTNQYTVTVIG